MNGKFVVVTTGKDNRGVFGGVLMSSDGDAVELTNAQMCVYWSTETRGVLGLAAGGPAKGSKVTAAVPSLHLTNVTAVIEATDKARKAWESQPWG